jgi:hypothetical protein
VFALQALQRAPTRACALGLPAGPAHRAILALRCAAVARHAIQGREKLMPIILWLLGVPLGVVVLLWLFHVI